MRFIVYVACLVTPAAPALAQCGWAGCGNDQSYWAPSFYPSFVQRQAPVIVVTVTPARDGYEWRARSDKPDELYLYRSGVQVGGWKHSERAYRSYSVERDEFSSLRCTRPPIELPGETPAPAAPTVRPVEEVLPNFGLDLERIRSSAAEYSLSGRTVSREVALAAIGQDLPADADALRLTWVGDEAVGERIRADILSSGLANKVTFQSYASPDLSMIRGLGFELGKLHIQAPNGALLHWQVGYTDQQGLTAAVAAAELRRRDPNFDPSRVPDLTKPKPKSPSDPNNGGITVPPPAAWPWWAWAGIGVAVLLILRRKDQ